MPDSIAWLFGLEQFGIKLGLENISTILDALGRPHQAFKSVHVAGTNGKGSVTAMVETALRAAGYRTGRYTSPHLVDLTERFAIDGRPVEGGDFTSVLADVRAAVERLLRSGSLEVYPTFFEVTTAVAFELFRRASVEIAVCEVGLGGRLDATNVLMPLVTAITSIGFDHQQYLGRTLREIAIEKAGIVKFGVPVVLGGMDEPAAAVIEEIARARRAPIVKAALGSFSDVVLGLRGRHQADNAAVAATILEVLEQGGIAVPRPAIVRGLADVVWPGRLDIRRLADGRELLMDAAHNPDGARALADFLRTSPFLEAPLVFGAMRDKDTIAMLSALVPVAGELIVTRPSNPRASDPVELADLVRTIAPALPVSIAEPPWAAINEASKRSRRIVVAGSIFLLGDVMKEAGWS